MVTMVSLSKMVDMALGTMDPGAVNFNILSNLLHTLLSKLNMGNVEGQVRYEDMERHGEGGDGQGIVSFRQLEKRVCDLEWRWQELNLIPTNSELFRRIRQLRGDAADADAADAGEEQEESDGEENLHKASQPVHEMWTQMQMMKQIETNTDGITKLMSMVDELFKEIDLMSSVRDLLLEKMNSTQEMESQFRDLMALLKMLENRITDQERNMAELPDEDYFDSLPTWEKIEMYFRGYHDGRLPSNTSVASTDKKPLAPVKMPPIHIIPATGSTDDLLGESASASSMFSTRGKRHRGENAETTELREREAELEQRMSSMFLFPDAKNSSNRNASNNSDQVDNTGAARSGSGGSGKSDGQRRRSSQDIKNTRSKDRNLNQDVVVENENVANEIEQESDALNEPGLKEEKPGNGGEQGRELVDDKEGTEGRSTTTPDKDCSDRGTPPTDGRRRSTKTPEAPATKRLKNMMTDLGTIVDRHEELVRRVDAIELWLRAELDKKADKNGGALRDIQSIVDQFGLLRDEMDCIRAMFNKESGALVCNQEKMKQLQADIDCILNACYSSADGGHEGGEGREGDKTDCKSDRGKPDCKALEVRVSWCAILEKIKDLRSDVEQIFKRVGGRVEPSKDYEPFITMTDVRLTVGPIEADLRNKVPYELLLVISQGLGDVVDETLTKILENDNEWRRIVGFLTGVVDTKLSREDMDAFSAAQENKLRCMSRRLTALSRRLDGEAADDPAAGTKKAKCLSCDRVTRYDREDGEVETKNVLPPGLPARRLMKAFTSWEMEQFRQIARSMPSPLRPNDACNPYAVYRRTGGITRKKQAAKRFVDTPACGAKDLVECEDECVNGAQNIQKVSCVIPVDVTEAVRDTTQVSSAPTSAIGDVSVTADTAGHRPKKFPIKSTVDDAAAVKAAPKQPPATDNRLLAATSPCMVKSDLREFIVRQRKEVSEIVAKNPAVASLGSNKSPYSWPTRSLGQQVSGSLTRVANGESENSSGSRGRACSSSFRLGIQNTSSH